MRLEHHLVGGYVRYISPHINIIIIIIINCNQIHMIFRFISKIFRKKDGSFQTLLHIYAYTYTTSSEVKVVYHLTYGSFHHVGAPICDGVNCYIHKCTGHLLSLIISAHSQLFFKLE